MDSCRSQSIPLNSSQFTQCLLSNPLKQTAVDPPFNPFNPASNPLNPPTNSLNQSRNERPFKNPSISLNLPQPLQSLSSNLQKGDHHSCSTDFLRSGQLVYIKRPVAYRPSLSHGILTPLTKLVPYHSTPHSTIHQSLSPQSLANHSIAHGL